MDAQVVAYLGTGAGEEGKGVVVLQAGSGVSWAGDGWSSQEGAWRASLDWVTLCRLEVQQVQRDASVTSLHSPLSLELGSLVSGIRVEGGEE